MSDKQTFTGRREGVIHDRIFVRGLVLPIAIGVYDEEQGITQKVRFTIEASVAAGVSPEGRQHRRGAVVRRPRRRCEVHRRRGAYQSRRDARGAHRRALPRRQAHRVGAGAGREARARPRCGGRRDRAPAHAVSALGPADGRQARRQPGRERAPRLDLEDRRARARPSSSCRAAALFADAVRAAQAEHGFSQAVGPPHGDPRHAPDRA